MSTSSGAQVLAWLFWIPVASLLATEAYVSNFDGMGAWAAAPLFLVPIFLSLVIGAAGLLQLAIEWRAGASRRSTALLAIVALTPLFWVFVRRFFV